MTQGSDRQAETAGRKTSGTPSDAFDLLWTALVDVLGAPATAALLRRSVRQRVGEYPELKELAIARNGFEYVYTVPPIWKQANEQSSLAFQALLRDLCSLLLELTGPLVVNRLKVLPQLAGCGSSASEGKL